MSYFLAIQQPDQGTVCNVYSMGAFRLTSLCIQLKERAILFSLS